MPPGPPRTLVADAVPQKAAKCRAQGDVCHLGALKKGGIGGVPTVERSLHLGEGQHIALVGVAQAPCMAAPPPQPRGHNQNPLPPPPPPPPSFTTTSSILAFTSSILVAASSSFILFPPAASFFFLFSSYFFSFFLLFSSFFLYFFLLFLSCSDESDDSSLEESPAGWEAG